MHIFTTFPPCYWHPWSLSTQQISKYRNQAEEIGGGPSEEENEETLNFEIQMQNFESSPVLDYLFDD